ncbi:MAG: serine/threonine-protein kinase, partial [Polyangiales bacterium]
MNIDEFGLVGRRIEERYDVELVVAAGGFGTVYLGRHRALRTPVAIKVLRIPTHLGDAARVEFAQRFLAEAQTIGQLQHPAVVRAVDFGVSAMPSGESVPWMALEWVDGPTLRQFLEARSGQPMSPPEALALLRPVLEALASAHADGIAHRDIKPANIMLPRGAAALPSRILDFGIAKAMRPEESAG